MKRIDEITLYVVAVGSLVWAIITAILPHNKVSFTLALWMIVLIVVMRLVIGFVFDRLKLFPQLFVKRRIHETDRKHPSIHVRNKLYKVIKLLRPKQWVKNIAIFATVVFTGQLFNETLFPKVLMGAIVFCGLSSAIYVINDIFDIQNDRMHPFKRFRPIAHGDVTVPEAVSIALALILFSFIFSAFVTPTFFLVAGVYLLLQLGYSLFLKHIAVIDILTLAAGYMLRVYAGEFATGFRVSVWLLLTTIALSLFLAVGKRKSELTLISHLPAASLEATRKTLSHYSDSLLDMYASIFATATFIFYSLFTFLQQPEGSKITLGVLLPDYLPNFFQRKWLMVTIVPVVYGLMRYLQDIYEKHEGESPEKVLLSDIPLLVTVTLWAVLVILIIYVIGG